MYELFIVRGSIVGGEAVRYEVSAGKFPSKEAAADVLYRTFHLNAYVKDEKGEIFPLKERPIKDSDDYVELYF